MMPGKVLTGQYGGSDQGWELNGDSGITDGSNVTVISPLLSIGDDDLLAHQRVNQVICG